MCIFKLKIYYITCNIFEYTDTCIHRTMEIYLDIHTIDRNIGTPDTNRDFNDNAF